MQWWRALLTAWRNKGKNGLTLPFLIGSQRYLPSSNYLLIRDLVIEIAMNIEIQVILTYCMDINELILSIRDKNNQRLVGSFAKLSNGIETNLFVSKVVGIYDLDCVIEHLEDRYEHLEGNKFSKINHGEWGDFVKSEIEFIRKILNE